MKQEKYGFVYIWYDTGKNRYYLGAHWGTEDDGYICSSKWMSMSKLRRPSDFKRRIISRHKTKEETFNEEFRILQMIKDEELGIRYYNKHKNIKICDGPAWNKGKKLHYDVWNKNKKGSYSLVHKGSFKKGQQPWNEGLTVDDPRVNKYTIKRLKTIELRKAEGRDYSNKFKGKIRTDLSEQARYNMGWTRGLKLRPRTDEEKRITGQKNSVHMNKKWQDPEYKKMQSESHKGNKTYTNGIEYRQFKPGKQPEGWVEGARKGYKCKPRKENWNKRPQHKEHNPQYGKHWYNNGKIAKTFHPNEVPDGWTKGRVLTL